MQGSSLERNIPGIPYGMNERQRWLLANAMVVAHKKANKRCSIATINLLHCKQASRKAIALAYLMIKFGNLWSKPQKLNKIHNIILFLLIFIILFLIL